MAGQLNTSLNHTISPLRVLHVTDKQIPPSADDGGSPQFVAYLAAAQHGKGHEPFVASTSTISGPRTLSLNADTDLTAQIIASCRNNAVDVVHFHAYAEVLQPALTEAGIASVSHVHGDSKGAAANCCNCIYVSKSHAQRSGGAVYVHNGIDLAEQPFEAVPEDYLVFLGKVRRSKKGADIAVSVAKAVNQHLCLIGGRKFSIPETWLPIDRRISALGVLSGDDKKSTLSKARALLFPIRWEEPFGLVLIEAMACGVPVIAFNRGAAPEIIRDGVTGFVVDSFEEMCAAVERICELDRAACREHVANNFTIERTAAGIEECYRRAMAGEVW